MLVRASGRSTPKSRMLAFHGSWYRAWLSLAHQVSRSVTSVKFFVPHLWNERQTGMSPPWESGRDAGECWADDLWSACNLQPHPQVHSNTVIFTGLSGQSV